LKVDLTSDRAMLALSSATVIGLALAAIDEFVLAGPWGLAGLCLVYVAGGLPAFYSAVSELWNHRILDIDFLMVIAAIAAAAVGAPFEGAVLLTLFSISTTLEHRALARARRAVEGLMALRPDTALKRMPDGNVCEIPSDKLQPGDLVILRPGAKVPADGIVETGLGSIDEATITGESMPVEKAPGSKVYEATVNLNAVLVVEITSSIAESTVSRMIELVTQAQAARAPSERFSDWFGQRYTVAVLGGAVLAFCIFAYMGWAIEDALYRAATLLVAASPCAIVISVPAAILSALAASARGGVLFKGGSALESLADVTTFAFDKTGTLTTGKAEVTGVLSNGSEQDLLSLAAGIEAHSEHPSAAAIRNYADSCSVRAVAVADVETIPSEGIRGRFGQDIVWAGNKRIVERMGADRSDSSLSSFADRPESIIYVGRGDQLIGAISVADRPRITSAAALSALRSEGVLHIAMMTGDRRPVALRVGVELGFAPEDIHSDLLPGDKVRLVGEMAKNGKIAFVGDGVNDAAALARADVGIAMGAAGSEVALQAADVALLSENMERLAAAQRLARRTRTVIRQNLAFAIGAMVILVASSLFFSLPLPLAVIGHEGGTVLVVLNGLRLLADPIRKTWNQSTSPGSDQLRPEFSAI
jgi:heavy metal translocating P-type ATPase